MPELSENQHIWESVWGRALRCTCAVGVGAE